MDRAKRSATLGVALGLLCAPVRQAGAQSRTSPSCIATWSESRFDGGGYDHWVSVSNECAAPITCSVWTDVNPNAQVVLLESKQSVSVLTFRASPARVFTPQVVCGFQWGK